MRESFDFAEAPPLLEVSLDAVPEECVVKEMIDGLVELDWCTVIGVKPGTRSMGTSSQLQVSRFTKIMLDCMLVLLLC